MAYSSTLLLMLAGGVVCLAMIVSAECSHHGNNKTENLLDDFGKDIQASIKDLTTYFDVLAKEYKNVEYEEKFKKIINLVYDAPEVKEAKEKIKKDVETLIESLQKLAEKAQKS